MLNDSLRLDRAFSALADPVRRGMLAQLALGPASVSELASPLPISLPAVLQHLKALETSGEAGNTVVIVTSDHGMPFPRVKGHNYDMANRVPLVVSGPKGVVTPGRRVADFVSLIDLAPTMLDLYRVDGVPTHVFIDQAGVVRSLYAGELDGAGMDAQLARIVPR